jgi:carboxylesterase type B
MNSGSIIPAQDVDSATAQTVYNQVVSKAGCSKASDTLNCLRGVDYSTMLAAANSVPGLLGYRSVDLSYLPRPDPSDNFFPQSPELCAGNAAKVPIIIGDQEDEGTLFALFQSNISTSAQLVDYLASYFPETSKSVVQGLVNLYPDDPTQGAPYNTGILYELYPEFKRLASILGDATFTLARRGYLETISSEVKAWSYLSSYFDSIPFLGTGHGTDILPLFFNFGIPSVPANTILTYYISFVNNLDPNAIQNLITWPQYTTSTKKLMNFNLLSNSLITDDFRQDAYEYLSAHVSNFRVKKSK